jgi:hypothetical protein
MILYSSPPPSNLFQQGVVGYIESRSSWKTSVVDPAQTAARVEQMCFSQSHKQLRPSLAWPMWAGCISQVKSETQGQLHSVPVF